MSLPPTSQPPTPAPHSNPPVLVMSDSNRQCLACSVVSSSRLSTGPDGRQTLCRLCHRTYSDKLLPLFQHPVTGRVSARHFHGSNHVRVIGWMSRSAGSNDMAVPGSGLHRDFSRPVVKPIEEIGRLTAGGVEIVECNLVDHDYDPEKGYMEPGTKDPKDTPITNNAPLEETNRRYRSGSSNIRTNNTNSVQPMTNCNETLSAKIPLITSRNGFVTDVVNHRRRNGLTPPMRQRANRLRLIRERMKLQQEKEEEERQALEEPVDSSSDDDYQDATWIPPHESSGEISPAAHEPNETLQYRSSQVEHPGEMSDGSAELEPSLPPIEVHSAAEQEEEEHHMTHDQQIDEENDEKDSVQREHILENIPQSRKNRKPIDLPDASALQIQIVNLVAENSTIEHLEACDNSVPHNTQLTDDSNNGTDQDVKPITLDSLTNSTDLHITTDAEVQPVLIDHGHAARGQSAENRIHLTEDKELISVEQGPAEGLLVPSHANQSKQAACKSEGSHMAKLGMEIQSISGPNENSIGPAHVKVLNKEANISNTPYLKVDSCNSSIGKAIKSPTELTRSDEGQGSGQVDSYEIISEDAMKRKEAQPSNRCEIKKEGPDVERHADFKMSTRKRPSCNSTNQSNVMVRPCKLQRTENIADASGIHISQVVGGRVDSNEGNGGYGNNRVEGNEDFNTLRGKLRKYLGELLPCVPNESQSISNAAHPATKAMSAPNISDGPLETIDLLKNLAKKMETHQRSGVFPNRQELQTSSQVQPRPRTRATGSRIENQARQDTQDLHKSITDRRAQEYPRGLQNHETRMHTVLSEKMTCAAGNPWQGKEQLTSQHALGREDVLLNSCLKTNDVSVVQVTKHTPVSNSSVDVHRKAVDMLERRLQHHGRSKPLDAVAQKMKPVWPKTAPSRKYNAPGLSNGQQSYTYAGNIGAQQWSGQLLQRGVSTQIGRSTQLIRPELNNTGRQSRVPVETRVRGLTEGSTSLASGSRVDARHESDIVASSGRGLCGRTNGFVLRGSGIGSNSLTERYRGAQIESQVSRLEGEGILRRSGSQDEWKVTGNGQDYARNLSLTGGGGWASDSSLRPLQSPTNASTGQFRNAPIQREVGTTAWTLYQGRSNGGMGRTAGTMGSVDLTKTGGPRVVPKMPCTSTSHNTPRLLQPRALTSERQVLSAARWKADSGQQHRQGMLADQNVQSVYNNGRNAQLHTLFPGVQDRETPAVTTHHQIPRYRIDPFPIGSSRTAPHSLFNPSNALIIAAHQNGIIRQVHVPIASFNCFQSFRLALTSFYPRSASSSLIQYFNKFTAWVNLESDVNLNEMLTFVRVYTISPIHMRLLPVIH